MTGGGFGALDFMNKTMRSNRALLRRKNLFEIRKELKEPINKHQEKIQYRKASRKELEQIKARLIKENNRRNVKHVFILLFSIAVVSLLVFYYFGY